MCLVPDRSPTRRLYPQHQRRHLRHWISGRLLHTHLPGHYHHSTHRPGSNRLAPELRRRWPSGIGYFLLCAWHVGIWRHVYTGDHGRCQCIIVTALQAVVYSLPQTYN